MRCDVTLYVRPKHLMDVTVWCAHALSQWTVLDDRGRTGCWCFAFHVAGDRLFASMNALCALHAIDVMVDHVQVAP